MAISKAILAALKAMSYADISVKHHYKAGRLINIITHPSAPAKLKYKIWDHTIMVDGNSLPVRVFFPQKARSEQIILYFHGGGWVTGNIDSYTNVCANISNELGRLVMSVDYRLAPEYPFPCAVFDCYGVTRELIFGETELHGRQIILMGDSAGANLAAVVSLMARDRGEFSIKKQILLYPATNNDHTKDSPFESVRTNGTDFLLTSKRICDYMDLYVQSPSHRQSPYFAPLLAKSLANQPDTLVITAEFDPLRDEGEAYGVKLGQAGNYSEVYRIKDAIHGFISLPPNAPHVKQTIALINQFLNAEEAAQL